MALETVFIVAEFNGVHSSRVRGTACAFCSASHTLSGDAGLWGSPPFCFFWHRRERSGVYFARVILRRLTVTDACPKHREAALSNVVYSHLPLRYSSADEEHCSSPPATLAAACDMMRFRLKTSLESDETHAIAPPPGSHVHPSPFSPYAIAFKIERVEPQALPQHPRQAPSPRSTCARLLTTSPWTPSAVVPALVSSLVFRPAIVQDEVVRMLLKRAINHPYQTIPHHPENWPSISRPESPGQHFLSVAMPSSSM